MKPCPLLHVKQTCKLETMPSPTIAQRRAAGRALREVAPLPALAALPPARDPLPILAARDQGRLPWLLGERNSRMAQTPASFLRGAAILMAADLAATADSPGPPPLAVQAAGDAHLFNFGAVFSPEGAALFDLNDFDETARAPFAWDIKRLAASLVLAAGRTATTATSVARRAARAYAAHMSALAALPPLDAWHSRIELPAEIAAIAPKRLRVAEAARLASVAAAHQAHFRLIEARPGQPPRLITDGSRVLPMPPAEQAAIAAAFALYRDRLDEDLRLLLARYELADIAYKIVGIGSVGTTCAILLLATPDGAPLLLQLKQAEISALAAWPPAPEALAGANQGARVVLGQRLMQAAPDLFLGWTHDGQGRDFYLRRLKDNRLARLGDAIEADALPFYAGLCGRTLARAHARSADAATLAGYLGGGGKFADAIADFARAYAARTEADWSIFKTALADRALPWQPLTPRP
jgi:uncharacterized protein (DUF2252 family)